MPADVGTIRRHNLALVLGCLHRRGGLARTELAEATGLVHASITTLVGDLVARGLVRERKDHPTSGPPPGRGRPRTIIEIVPQRCVVLAVQIGLESVTATLSDLDGTSHWSTETRHGARYGDPEPVAAAVAAALARAQQFAREASGVLAHCVVAMAGPVDSASGVVVAAIDFGWDHVPLLALVSERAGVECAMTLVNDGSTAALAEYRALCTERGRSGSGAAAPGDREAPPRATMPRVMVYAKADTGVGGGIVIDGQIFGGENGLAGEVGHVSVDHAGRACHCGSLGCLATYVGPDALAADAGLGALAEAEGVSAAMARLLCQARAGESRTVAVLEAAAEMLGSGLLSVSDVVNAGHLVLGGYFADLSDWLLPGVTRVFNRRPVALHLPPVPVTLGRLGRRAVLDGALILGFERVLADPTLVPLR
ncbi:MAG: ROK family transcriptional regulator [Micromonosporaceae bacterium]|nr:ROK family transcriptional regulator [Micromonosporaceae bacterium]